MVLSRLYERNAERSNDNQESICNARQRGVRVEGRKEKADVSVADYKVKSVSFVQREPRKPRKQANNQSENDRQGNNRLDTILDTGKRPREVSKREGKEQIIKSL
jgi:hypothetical protein